MYWNKFEILSILQDYYNQNISTALVFFILEIVNTIGAFTFTCKKLNLHKIHLKTKLLKKKISFRPIVLKGHNLTIICIIFI